MLSKRLLLLFVIAFALAANGRLAGQLSGEVDQTSEAQSDHRIGEKVADFELQDFRGRSYMLSDFQDQEVIVLAFWGTECPLAKLYGPTLNEFAAAYADRGVAMLGINSNSQDAVTEIAAQVRRQSLEFPMLKDVGNQVADAVGATRTPEIFVLDSDRVIRYQGRIDDRYGIGSVRPEAATSFMQEAVDSLLDSQPVRVAFEPAVGCLIGKTLEPVSESEVTYTRHISRIMQQRCIECHRSGEIAPFALTEYEEVRGWAEMIAEVVDENRMPPWHAEGNHVEFKNDRSMSESEKELIYTWVDNGAPYGDADELPPPRTFVSGWQLPSEPDLVIPIHKTPITVPATGEVEYLYLEVTKEDVPELGFEEDYRWIKAAELLPGNFSVVHHILVFAVPPGESLEFTGAGTRGFLVGYVPGLRVEPYPVGFAKRLPKDSTLVFQVHYTPNGVEQQDLSQLGIVFAEPDEVTHEVLTTSAIQMHLRIPAGDAAHQERAFNHQPLGNYQLLSLMPHMHLRGSAFRYELIQPDQTSQVLLDVPAYDFNWQTDYRLKEPLALASGARIKCTATYDNSTDNPFNPEPNQVVGWGEQTWDEMMIGYFDVAIPRDEANELYESKLAAANDQIGLRSRMLVASNDENGDQALSSDEMPLVLRRNLRQLDRDRDGQLSLQEVQAAYRR